MFVEIPAKLPSSVEDTLPRVSLWCDARGGMQPGNSKGAEEDHAVFPHRLPPLVRTAGLAYDFFMYLLAFSKTSGC